MQRRFHFLSALAGGLIAALAVTALPGIAQEAEPQAAPGSPFLLGQTNTVQANTGLRGTSTSNLVVRNTGNGVPLNLVNAGNGKPPMKVDSRRLVRNLNADKLDFRDANELIRAAFDSTDDAAEDVTEAVTASITAPRPGYLIMGGSIDGFGSDQDDYACRLTVDGAVVTGTERDSVVHDAGGLHTTNSTENCSTNGGLAVGPGNHSVALNIFGRDSVSLRGASVWVIWVPFDGQGNVPSPPDNPTPNLDPARLDEGPDETG